MSKLTVYGIKNCDTCRKALKWLEQEGKPYRWQDLRADGVDHQQLQRWMAAVGADTLINRRSTTWRSLGPVDRAAADDPETAASLLRANPTLIKRPVFALDDDILVGFNAVVQEKL